MRASPWLTADEAAAALRVSRATLYAYVSRGRIRSQSLPGVSRARAYAREDVERLRRRTEERRDPDKAAAHTLQWGMPVLESAITLIDGNALYYRGHDALTLARTRTFEEVASLVWTGQFATPHAGAVRGRPAGDDRPVERAMRALPFTARAQAMLVTMSADDPAAVDIRPAQVVATGWRILQLLTSAVAADGRPSGADARRRRPSGRPAPSTSSAIAVDRALARAWHVPDRGVDVLRSALILCADHELNVSSFTARCVASAGSSPYAVVIAGLAALEGPRHGGASARVDAMLTSMRKERRLRRAVTERLRRGEAIFGFGHPLYPKGDPRAILLIDLLKARYPESAELAFVLEFAEAAASVIRERPSVDFALAAMARVMRLPPDAPLTLFAIGRTVGWIGQAIEQYATAQLIRPRARYTGVVPIAPATTVLPAMARRN